MPRFAPLSFTAWAIAVWLATWPIAGSAEEPAGPWPVERANAWYEARPWLVGCNYVPSTAINQLEMWQAATFDPDTIDRELGWAHDLGFNSIRVFLHDKLWEQDSEGFLGRIDQFLRIADGHGIGVMFVLFDGVWDPEPRLGPQREPSPHVHNSGWVQGPGSEILGDPAKHAALEGYVTGVVRRFRHDPRVQVWDIFNEPDNPNRNSYGDRELPDKADKALTLLRKAYAWTRSCDPSQPLTSGVWVGEWSDPGSLSEIERFQLDQSDVISFHSYTPLTETRRRVENLRRYGRPILCTEYMARPAGSTFDPLLAYFREAKVGAYNWGFVAGRSQTIYPWDSWQRRYDAEPPVWFHDIFRPDGTPYRADEVELIRRVTGAREP